jgi:pimeloyl-ACP methyl ester carboxylesterase
MQLTIIVVMAALLLLWLVLGYWLANLFLYARRQPISRTPAEYGMAYEDIRFVSHDRLMLNGWWIPAPGRVGNVPAVILVHPMFGNRHGLVRQAQQWPFRVSAEVDLLQMARAFHAAGYAALMFDLRSHGESQRSLCGGGFTEDQDVMAAVDYVFARLAATTTAEQAAPKSSVGIVGFGMGAVAAIAAIGREKGGAEMIHVYSGDSAGGSGFVKIPPLPVKYLRFVVAVQPISQARLLREHLRVGRFRWGWAMLPLVDWICQRRGGFPLSGIALLRFARGVNVPVLYACSAVDTGANLREAQVIYDALAGEKEMWWLDHLTEPFDVYRVVGGCAARMLAFAAAQMQDGKIR